MQPNQQRDNLQHLVEHLHSEVVDLHLDQLLHPLHLPHQDQHLVEIQLLVQQQNHHLLQILLQLVVQHLVVEVDLLRKFICHFKKTYFLNIIAF